MSTSADETFNRLRRIPFNQVMSSTSIELFNNTDYVDRLIKITAHPDTAKPSASWENYYAEMGWTWEELVRESKRRLNG